MAPTAAPLDPERDLRFRRSFPALGTTAMVVTTGAGTIEVAERALRDELEAIDRSCSRFRPGSEISRVNSANGRPVAVSALLVDAVTIALQAAAWTGGAVDPTVGRCVIGLGYDRDFDLVPVDGPPLPAMMGPVPGWECIELDPRAGVVRVPAGVVVDLGATAKAFAADRAAARIARATGTGVLVNLGGDISLAGPAPDGGWPVGVAPDCTTSPGNADVVVALGRGGLASSGTSVRRWRRGGKQVHHIVDPRTGHSASACWQLATVAAPTCAQANAASTAAIVWGEQAPARLAALGLACRLARSDGRVVVLGGWPADEAGAHGQPDDAGPAGEAA